MTETSKNITRTLKTIFNYLIVATIIAAMGYFLKIEQEKNNSNIQKIQQINAEEKENSNKIAKTQRKIGAIEKQINAALSNQKNIKEIWQKYQQEQKNKSSKNWLIAEAAYNLNVAQKRIMIENDATTAIYLMNEAIKLITESRAPIAIKITQDIKTDIQRVISNNTESNADFFNQINEIINKVDQIQWVTFEQRPEAAAIKEPQNNTQVSDQNNKIIEVVESVIKEIFIVHPKHKTNIVSPDKIWYLQENIKHQLEIMEISLYKNHAQRFTAAVQKIIKIMETYAKLNETGTRKIFNEIKAFIDVKIKESKDIKIQFNSIKVIENYMAQSQKATEAI